MTKDNLNLSIAIITFNEEANIAKLINHISGLASEIIVIDSYSSDDTKIIAEEMGAKVFLQFWLGYAEQKNVALSHCTKDWILFLDCDEFPDDKLMNNIRNLVKAQEKTFDKYKFEKRIYKNFKIKRKTFYLGKLLNYAWQPDINLRLVHRSNNPIWKGEIVHEWLEAEGEVEILEGYLIHYSYKNIRHHLEKTIDYAQKAAELNYKKGKKFRYSNLILNPLVAFVRMLVFRKAYKDSFAGFVACFSTFLYTFLKYLFLKEMYYRNR